MHVRPHFHWQPDCFHLPFTSSQMERCAYSCVLRVNVCAQLHQQPNCLSIPIRCNSIAPRPRQHPYCPHVQQQQQQQNAANFGHQRIAHARCLPCSPALVLFPGTPHPQPHVAAYFSGLWSVNAHRPPSPLQAPVRLSRSPYPQHDGAALILSCPVHAHRRITLPATLWCPPDHRQRDQGREQPDAAACVLSDPVHGRRPPFPSRAVSPCPHAAAISSGV
mmetsp:Transcript_39687/g.66608  ORF Transcript_39687/g.66608 Transcript_39687/m.66608 type:complete len:220 (-) Transcript_39687:460-1119(-)